MLLTGLIFTKTTLFFFILLIILEIMLKWIALYRAWNRKDIWRFICLFIFNTCWILPIIYLLFSSEDANKENNQKEDNIDLPKENNKLKNSNTKPTKKTTKGGVIKWGSAKPTKSSKGASSATTKRNTKEKKTLKNKQKN